MTTEQKTPEVLGYHGEKVPIPIEDFVSQLDMRCRLQGNGHHLLLAMDRLACPMPGHKNMTRLKTATNDIGKWSTTLPPEINKQIQSMITGHIRVSVEYLRKMYADQNKEQGEQA
ncbi:hypothetical protein ACKF11_13490 [Methylobacillus sp. Pita2]|uniref:hypothetical protein n=1 Tax=Methylobacillus sp. Pita2 TaxID=3383245 RepID=UPI0038B65DE4